MHLLLFMKSEEQKGGKNGQQRNGIDKKRKEKKGMSMKGKEKKKEERNGMEMIGGIKEKTPPVVMLIVELSVTSRTMIVRFPVRTVAEIGTWREVVKEVEQKKGKKRKRRR